MTTPTPAQADEKALTLAVLAYDEARCALHAPGEQAMSERNRQTIAPMILAAVHAYNAAIRPEGEPVAFDPLNGGCPHCKWLDTNLGRALDKKCELHQRIEDMQADQQLDRRVIREQATLIRRFCEAIGAGDDEDPVDVAKTRMEELAELEASPPAPAVKVKVLEWSEIERDRGDGQTDKLGEWEAPSIVGVYAINISTCGDMYAPWEVFGSDDSKLGNFATLDEAKAAAQADYEARILSALLPPEEAQAAAPAEALPAGVEAAVEHVRYCWEVIQGQCSDGDGFTERAAMDLELAICALASLSPAPAQAGSAGEGQMLASASVRPEPWQDIATAPKGGSNILVGGCSYGPRVRIAGWGNGRFLGRKKGYEQGWCHMPGHLCDPTHWMPLPPPPLSDSKAALADAHSNPDPHPEPVKEG